MGSDVAPRVIHLCVVRDRMCGHRCECEHCMCGQRCECEHSREKDRGRDRQRERQSAERLRLLVGVIVVHNRCGAWTQFVDTVSDSRSAK